MSKQEPAEQVKFLVSCIGHTTNGRPDFQAVAEELSIISKAAAQKRYERMLKAHGIKPGRKAPVKEETSSGASDGEKAPVDKAPVEKTPAVKATKRKAKAEPAAKPAKKRAPPKKRAPKKEDTDEEEEVKQEVAESSKSPASSLSGMSGESCALCVHVADDLPGTDAPASGDDET
ncbi:hypothetical protein AK830_g9347 [Neonectria ditissima]|uniref:Myb-like DNA-binding domain-containing protein n=1 Tax=Neonectria ditissima TaxID=78410 RepID=A0A0P7AUY8_9HYPO|nr:hypothetical protein AK830_g9347 [Neonectria ditissima]